MAAATSQEQERAEYRRMDDYDNTRVGASASEWAQQLAECQRHWLDFCEVWVRTALYPVRALQEQANRR
jgi:hypothetical protein